MVLESGNITQEGIERLRARLGSYNRPRQYGVGLFNEEASRSAIRHFCQGIGDSNPLYWDISYGQQSKFGTIIAPPCFLYSVYWCSGRTGGLPGVHGFHAGNDWEWYRPIYMDDKISVQEQFTGLEEKESEFAGKILIQSSVSHYFNQRGEVLGKTRGWQIRAERTAARERQKYTFEPYQYSRDEILAIQQAVLGEEIGAAIPAGGRTFRWAMRFSRWSRADEPRRHHRLCRRLHRGHFPRYSIARDAASPLLGVYRPQYRSPGSHHPRPRHPGGRRKRRTARRPMTTAANAAAGWAIC